MFNRRITPNYDKPTSELFMDAIIERKQCHIHQVGAGTPCWTILRDNGSVLRAVCNKRAKGTGFNARIRRESLHLRRQTRT